MNTSTTPNSFIMRNSVFAWIALAAGCVLLIPLIAMRFSDAVNWDATDFVVAGALLLGAGSVFVLAARAVPRKYRVAVAVAVAVALGYAWVELAVGIFFHLGS